MAEPQTPKGGSVTPPQTDQVPDSGLGDSNEPAFIPEEGQPAAQFPPEIDATKVGDVSETPESDTPEGEPFQETTPEEDQPFRSFKTQQELDDYVELQARRREEAAKAKKDEKPEEKEPLKLYDGYFDEEQQKWIGEAPQDWNEFATRIRDSLVPEVSETVKNMSAKERQELEELNKEFDTEYNGLAAQGKVPPLNTPEGKEANRQISHIAAVNGFATITEGYEVWNKMRADLQKPKNDEGGQEPQGGSKAPQQPAKPNPNKAASGMVGSSKGVPSKGNKTERSYDQLHDANTDDLIEERLNQ